MRVAVLHVELFIPHALSLKDKRMVLRRVKDRLGKFNVAVAEVEHQDAVAAAALGIVAVLHPRRITSSSSCRRAADRDRSRRARGSSPAPSWSFLAIAAGPMAQGYRPNRVGDQIPRE
jgi:uncharacterized protein YlxP (DUF503 family)